MSAALQVYMQIPEDIRKRMTERAQALQEAREHVESERDQMFLTQSSGITFATLLCLFLGGAPVWIAFLIVAVWCGANLLDLYLSDRAFKRLMRKVRA